MPRTMPTPAHPGPTKDQPTMKTQQKLQALRVERAWAGYYEMNRFDQNAFIGPHPGLRGYAVLAGFSGHGMQHAPGAGLALAEWLLHGQPRSVDVRPLGLQRWLDGQPLHEANVIG